MVEESKIKILDIQLFDSNRNKKKYENYFRK